MSGYKKILCGVDLSNGSKCALRQAARIAKWSEAELTVIHVLDPHFTEIFPEVDTQGLEASTAANLDNTIFEVLGGTEDVRQEVVSGRPYSVLADVVTHTNTDLLVLGVHGHGTLWGEASPAGTVARKCVRRVPCEVLLCRGDQPSDFRNIVLCTDFSDTSERALVEAIQIAKREKSRLEIIHSTMTPERILHGMADAQLAALATPDAFRARVKESMDRFLEPYLSELGELDFDYTVVEARRSPTNSLIHLIEERKPDLVVLGTHGRGPLTSLLLGTTAEKILSHAPCSILTVKPEKFS